MSFSLNGWYTKKGARQQSHRHATTLSLIALYYSQKGCKVIIPYEVENNKNPDIIIDNLKCELKVISESEWMTNFDGKTGVTEEHDLSKDLCFDIGQFIRDRSNKGIKQADLIFSDLTFKSIGWLNKIYESENKCFNFPSLQENRIIFFSRRILNFNGYYIDIDPLLWNSIRNTKIKHGFFRYPI